MNYMAVAFQKVRQACRNENSSFPNGSSLRKVETLTDSDNAVEKRVAFQTILPTKLERDNRGECNDTFERAAVIVLSSFLSRESQKGVIERSSKAYRGFVAWYPAVESAEWIVSKNIYAISSRSPADRTTPRLHFHSFNAITRRAHVVARPSYGITRSGEQLVVAVPEITHVATQPRSFARGFALPRELASVDGIKRSRRANQSMTPNCSVEMVQSSAVDLDLWLVRIVHSCRVTRSQFSALINVIGSGWKSSFDPTLFLLLLLLRSFLRERVFRRSLRFQFFHSAFSRCIYFLFGFKL